MAEVRHVPLAGLGPPLAAAAQGLVITVSLLSRRIWANSRSVEHFDPGRPVRGAKRALGRQMAPGWGNRPIGHLDPFNGCLMAPSVPGLAGGRYLGLG